LCTRRSKMLSAKVGSPICSCHLATVSWLVKMVEVDDGPDRGSDPAGVWRELPSRSYRSSNA
jgi:hypothetical protein